MTSFGRIHALAFGLAVSGGCYDGLEDGGLDDTHSRKVQINSTQLNGFKINGFKINGIEVNGFKINGFKINGIKVNGFKINGFKINGFKINGSTFTATTAENGGTITRSGEDLVGLEMEIAVDGLDAKKKPVTEIFTLRFDDIYADPETAEGDLLHYYVSYRPMGGNSWTPLCTDGDGDPIHAIAMQNYWDEESGDRVDDAGAFTFACADGVLAKCAEWGYRPWGEAWMCPKWDKGKKCDLVSLQDHHQACTRMARADYCGDGQPWTITGNIIDVYDHLFEQIEAPESVGWQVEAEWNPNGAYCLQDIRMQAWKAQGLYPDCGWKKAKPRKDCGSLKDHRALLVSSFYKPPPPPKPDKPKPKW